MLSGKSEQHELRPMELLCKCIMRKDQRKDRPGPYSSCGVAWQQNKTMKYIKAQDNDMSETAVLNMVRRLAE